MVGRGAAQPTWERMSGVLTLPVDTVGGLIASVGPRSCRKKARRRNAPRSITARHYSYVYRMFQFVGEVGESGGFLLESVFDKTKLVNTNDI